MTNTPLLINGGVHMKVYAPFRQQNQLADKKAHLHQEVEAPPAIQLINKKIVFFKILFILI